MLETFMRERPYFLLLELKKKFDLNGPFSCKIFIPNGVSLEIDSYIYNSEYIGYYFKNTPIELNVPESFHSDFKYWLVDGEKITQRNIQLQLSKDTTIDAVFK